MPGEVFVHRNVANVVWETDLNCMSVLEFAIRVIQVRHVIVCGHYGCAGVRAATEDGTDGVAEHWLSGIRKLWHANRSELEQLPPEEAQEKLCELNVKQQVKSLCESTVMQQAWRRGQEVDVHSWIYGLNDGRIRDLGLRVTSVEEMQRL
jgi:carbonic anhydrase